MKGRLDLAVSDLSPTQLKNITEPIRVYALQVGAPMVAKLVLEARASEPKWRRAAVPLVAGIVALLLIAGGAWYFLAPNRSAQATHLSIVVLPFANLSNDPAQDYFAEGITENLTTDLSRIKNSFVIARNTAYAFKRKLVDAGRSGAAGRTLCARRLGATRPNRVRVNAQLTLQAAEPAQVGRSTNTACRVRDDLRGA